MTNYRGSAIHQVKALDNKGALSSYHDLATALNLPIDVLRRTQKWRVHFHVPLYCAKLNHEKISTTQAALLRALDFLSDYAEQNFSPFIEVETYSWQVLPRSLRPHDTASLHRNIVKELAWLERQLINRGLLNQCA